MQACANAADNTLQFNGTISKTIDNSMTVEFSYDGTSNDEYNGWVLVGNPFACNAYISYVDGEGNALPFNMYVLNETGDEFEPAASNVLSPLTAAFIKVNTSGTILYSTEPVETSAALASVVTPCLPSVHGATDSRDANECNATLTITVTANPAEGGSVSGAGSYNNGASVTVTSSWVMLGCCVCPRSCTCRLVCWLKR